MPSSRPTRWILALACGALMAAGCSTTTDTPAGETGSLSLDLVIADGIEIDQVGWQITGNGMDMSGVIDTSAPGSTASVEVFGLPPGEEDYTVTLAAESADELVGCRGSADFNVEIGETTDVMVILNCKLPRRLGGVRVNGKFNICAELIKAVVSPLQTSVGNDISLFSQAVDQDGDPIAYSWTGTGGSIANADEPSATYTCDEVGDHSVIISVTDNDEHCDMANWEIPVTCVPGDALECIDDADCDDGEVCVDNECVPDIECIDDDGCDEGEICFENKCVPDIECIDDDGCDEGEICVDNECVIDDLECNGNQDCDEGEFCLNGECRTDPNVFCDEGICATDDAARLECVGAFLTCLAEEPINEDECILVALLECNECNMDNDCAAEEICDDNVCVPAPDCISPGDCGDDNECTADLCVDGECSNPPVMDDTMCDNNMGTCSSGMCVPNDPCEGLDCSDDNDCTADVCIAGVCSNPELDADDMCNQDGGTVCDGAGSCVECNSDNQCDVEFSEVCVDNTCLAGCTVPAPVDAIGIPMACRNSFNQAVSTFPIDLTNVTPDDCIEAGQPVNFDIDPIIALDTAFLQAAAETLCDLGTLLTEADVTSAQVSIDAVAGATCTETLSVLSPVPETVEIDITLVSGSCGAGGEVEVNSGISLPLAPTTVPCSAAGAAGSEVQICSTGEVPLNITLADPPPPPAYTETYVGVSVGGGSIQVAFACNTSSTTSPAPGVTVNCTAPNPAGPCDDMVGVGDVGETPFPESDCDFSDGFPGDCETVPVGVDPSTVCATFTVQ